MLDIATKYGIIEQIFVTTYCVFEIVLRYKNLSVLVETDGILVTEQLASKIFEISDKKGIREIDHIRHRVDLGTDTYATGKVSNELAVKLCTDSEQYESVG